MQYPIPTKIACFASLSCDDRFLANPAELLEPDRMSAWQVQVGIAGSSTGTSESKLSLTEHNHQRPIDIARSIYFKLLAKYRH